MIRDVGLAHFSLPVQVAGDRYDWTVPHPHSSSSSSSSSPLKTSATLSFTASSRAFGLCLAPPRVMSSISSGSPSGPCLRQIKPVHGLGETQVGVDTGNDNACIYRQQLDAHKGHTNVDIDHQPLVQDCVDDIGEAARGGPLKYRLDVCCETVIQGYLLSGVAVMRLIRCVRR